MKFWLKSWIAAITVTSVAAPSGVCDSERGPKGVYVLGEVKHPGFYTTEGGFHTLYDVLRLAGGLNVNADVMHVRINQINSKTETANLWNLMMLGNTEKQVSLFDGAVVYVPGSNVTSSAKNTFPVAQIRKEIRVCGAVKTPGVMEISESEDLRAVLAKSGLSSNARYVVIASSHRDGTVSSKKIDLFEFFHSKVRIEINAGELLIVKSTLQSDFPRKPNEGQILPAQVFSCELVQHSGFAY